VGRRLYLKIFLPYTRKQWGRHPRELTPEVTARIPLRTNFDDRYFTDRYQALPAGAQPSSHPLHDTLQLAPCTLHPAP